MHNTTATHNLKHRTSMSNESLAEIRANVRDHPRLCNIEMNDALNGLTQILSRLYLLQGRTIDPTNVGLVAQTLYQELMDGEYGTRFLTLEEIKRVTKKAVLETDIYISVAALYKVLINYCKGEGHVAQKEAERITITNLPELLEAEAKRITKKFKI